MEFDMEFEQTAYETEEEYRSREDRNLKFKEFVDSLKFDKAALETLRRHPDLRASIQSREFRTMLRKYISETFMGQDLLKVLPLGISVGCETYFYLIVGDANYPVVYYDTKTKCIVTDHDQLRKNHWECRHWSRPGLSCKYIDVLEDKKYERKWIVIPTQWRPIRLLGLSCRR